MKQKIEFEIDVPEGKKAVLKGNKIVFEDVIGLPKTWEEFCANKSKIPGEAWIDWDSSISYVEGYRPDKMNPIEDKNLLPNTEAAEAHLALMQLHQLRDYYRQGWKPNWKESTYKWFICKEKNCLVVIAAVFYSEFLSFQSREIAQEFLTNFRELIEEARDLI